MIGIFYALGTLFSAIAGEVTNEYEKEKTKAQHPERPYYCDRRGREYDARTGKQVSIGRDPFTGSLCMYTVKGHYFMRNLDAPKHIARNKELIKKGATAVLNPQFSQERRTSANWDAHTIGWEFCDVLHPEYDPECEFSSGRTMYVREINFGFHHGRYHFKYYHCHRNYYVEPYVLKDEYGNEKKYVRLIRSTDGQRVLDVLRRKDWLKGRDNYLYHSDRPYSRTDEELKCEMDFQAIDEFVINESKKYLIPLEKESSIKAIDSKNEEMGITLSSQRNNIIQKKGRELIRENDLTDSQYELLKEW